jgi:hypothetical protein
MASIEINVLKEYLSYDPLTGVITWVKSPGRGVPLGTKAGCLRYDGYLLVRVFKKNYYFHRLAWALQTGEWPDKQVDHIDKNRQNNTFDNLRLASRSENQRNKNSAKNSSSKYLGVCFHKHNKKWQAQGIGQDSKNAYLGQYETEEEAAKAYNEYAQKTYGEFASLNAVGIAA